jgi:hypothetical protein
MSLCLLLDRHF